MVAAERQGRPHQGKARLARLEELQSVDYQKRNETNEIFIPPGERLGNSVIEFKNVSKKFGDRLLFENLNFLVPAAPSSASSAPTAPASRPCSR